MSSALKQGSSAMPFVIITFLSGASTRVAWPQHSIGDLKALILIGKGAETRVDLYDGDEELLQLPHEVPLVLHAVLWRISFYEHVFEELLGDIADAAEKLWRDNVYILKHRRCGGTLSYTAESR
jgi:hypothetical protein